MTTNEQKHESTTLSIEQQSQIDKVCTEVKRAYESGQAFRIEDLLSQMPEGLVHSALVSLIRVEIGLRGADAKHVESEYLERFPKFPAAVAEALQEDPGEQEQADEAPIPKRIDRFEIINVLGEGAFGRVYLARDSDMHREVALKVPSVGLFQSGEALQSFLQEARSAAKVKHPGLVAVYDVQRKSDQPYIVQEYIRGSNLADWLQQHKPNLRKIVELVAEIAEALVEAHRNDLVHRDLKPANILVDEDGHVHVADFGLALHSSWQRKHKGEIAGSPAYMSPEQTRGETHRIDGRTDIWSLGVIFYEMLVGQRPFIAEDRAELWEAIQYADVRPPSMRNPDVPNELDRICLVCLSKQQNDRYRSATHLLGDLRDWLVHHPEPSSFVTRSTLPLGNDQRETDRRIDTSVRVLRIIPRGLRSFEESDADFFLTLLPGVPDKVGLPPSVSFWKSRIDETDEDSTFSVAVMYGPSGCGKSSLVKAGILPRVGSHVVPIYIEATPNDTESRLLKELAKKAPTYPTSETDLPEVIRSVRSRTESGPKVLIVLDQFEQWLYDHGDDPSQPLIHALRHCDGGKVQCLLLIRDDFWTPVTRFMRQLEIRLLEDETVKSVDLFSLRHAEKVLTKFGQAYGTLPGRLEEEHRKFLAGSVAGLAKEGKVICVQVALFAQMMQDRPWTPESLEDVGGAEGVGVAFLEETFSSSTASKRHRSHQEAARRVLELLLPESGTDIKGAMRSHADLIQASDYSPDEFDELLQVLDSELRLITPTDPEELDRTHGEPAETRESKRYYQLTHDYLVPSLRDWLNQKRRETRRGRAELRLAELASHWHDKPEKRRLPSFWEFSNIRMLTKKRSWTEPQSQMMRKARSLHLMRTAMAAACLVLMGWIAYYSNGHIQSNTYIESLKTANADKVPETVSELRGYRRWAYPKLDDLLHNLEQRSTLTADETRHQLHARIALVEQDSSHYAPLKEELLSQRPTYLGCLLHALTPYQSQLVDELRDVLRDETIETRRRFRAGIALATYSPDEAWTDDDLAFVASELVDFTPEHQPMLRGLLEPIADRLLPHLESLFSSQDLSESQLIGAAAAVEEYARNEPELLSRLICVGTPKQFEILFPALSSIYDAEQLTYLQTSAAEQPSEELEPLARLHHGRKRASAAFALLRNGQHAEMFDALRVVDDPESITQFVHRCREFKITANDLLTCLNLADQTRNAKQGTEREIEDRVLYALILALGEFQLSDIPEAVRTAIVNKLTTWFQDDPDAGIHGATRWLLSNWGKKEVVEKLEQREVPYSQTRDWFTLEVKAGPDENAERFYLTFIVFPAGEYVIGSPEQEPLRNSDELRHKVTIDYDFAILDRELTFAELTAFHPSFNNIMSFYEYEPSHPAMGSTWYNGVHLSRWLTEAMGWSETTQCYPDQAIAIDEGHAADPEPRASGAPRNWPVNLTGGGFRLPTEAEWEIAYRGGNMHGAFHFGNDISRLSHYGWFAGNSNERMRPGRELRPNLRGLFDIHGNVAEWCHDWYDADSYKLTAPNPKGPDSKTADGREPTLRLIRGSSYRHPAKFCRASGRARNAPTYPNNSIGYRPVLVPDVQPALQPRAEDSSQ